MRIFALLAIGKLTDICAFRAHGALHYPPILRHQTFECSHIARQPHAVAYCTPRFTTLFSVAMAQAEVDWSQVIGLNRLLKNMDGVYATCNLILFKVSLILVSWLLSVICQVTPHPCAN